MIVHVVSSFENAVVAKRIMRLIQDTGHQIAYDWTACSTAQQLDERHTGVKTDKTDARALVLKLDQYVNGNRYALAVVRVPARQPEGTHQGWLAQLAAGFRWAYGFLPSRSILLLLVMLPFWISFLLRVYAWIGILNTNGLLNRLLLWVGVIHEPLQIMYSNTAIYIGIVYSYLPFMILPLYANLERLDPELRAAAADLGAHPWRVFLDITLPLSRPGIIAGGLLVFIPAMGEYVIPALLGGDDVLMIGRVVFDEFFLNHDWPIASAVAVVLLLLLVLPIVWFQHVQAGEGEA